MKRLVLIALLLTAWVMPTAASDHKLEPTTAGGMMELLRKALQSQGELCADETLRMSNAKWDDLLKRDGLFFKKFTNEPFSGRLIEPNMGLFCAGKPSGSFMWHRKSGELWAKAYYRDGKLDSTWTSYTKDGQLAEEGRYKRGKRSSVQKFLNDQYGKAPSLSWSARRLVKPDAPKMSGATCHYGSGIYENGRKVACLKGTPANRCFIPRKQAKYDC